VGSGGEGGYKGIARLLLKVPAFSGEVELELLGDAVTLRFNGLEAKGALPQLRSLCEEVGLSERDLLAVKQALKSVGLRVPEPPVPLELSKLLPSLSPLEALELLSTLPHGDLGLSDLLSLALEEGRVSEEDLKNPWKALSKVPSHVRARYAARLLEEWGLLRVVVLKLARELSILSQLLQVVRKYAARAGEGTFNSFPVAAEALAACLLINLSSANFEVPEISPALPTGACSGSREAFPDSRRKEGIWRERNSV